MTSLAGTDQVVFWLPASPMAGRVVRSRMRAFLQLPPDAQAAVAVVVTELVGRAVQHLGVDSEERFEVRLERAPGRAKITVEHGAAPDAGRFGREPEEDELQEALLAGLAVARGEEDGAAWVVVDG